jgi:hypothetical protein
VSAFCEREGKLKCDFSKIFVVVSRLLLSGRKLNLGGRAARSRYAFQENWEYGDSWALKSAMYRRWIFFHEQFARKPPEPAWDLGQW